MTLTIITLIGLVIFAVGLVQFVRGRDNMRSIQMYGFIAFLGLALALICGACIVMQKFPGIPNQYILGGLGLGFVVGCVIFLRPGFHNKW